jgi:hypothetical protein
VRVQRDEVGWKLNGAHQLLVYSVDAYLMGYNMNTVKENTEVVVDTNKKVDLVVNTEKIKYVLMSRHQNGGRNHTIKMASTHIENVAKLRYFGITVTNQNLINEEIKSRLISVPADLPPGKEPRYPLARRLGGPQNRTEQRGEEKILDRTGTRTPTPQPSSP